MYTNHGMKHRNMLTRKAGSAFSKLFITLCGQFNSRQVTVEKSSDAQQRDYYKYEQVGPSGMSLQTENFLKGNLIQKSQGVSPTQILKFADDFFQIAQDPVYLLIAADICRYFANQTDDDEKIGFHLSSLHYCSRILSYQKKKNPDMWKTMDNYLFLQGVQIVNEAGAGIFRYLKQKGLLDNDMFTLQGVNGVKFTMEKPDFHLSVPREAVSDFSLCSDYAVNALRLINRHSGIGIPLVARVKNQILSKSLKTPHGLTIPVTVFFRIKEHANDRISLCPVYCDTLLSESFDAQGNDYIGSGKKWILARDFTTPLACFMNNLSQRNLLSGMLHPSKYDEFSGLYMEEPYRPEKIPVVFVHGLMSSPETWGQMINTLKYDPRIRQKYQFWFYAYSTGTPVLYSAAKLRNALLEAQKEFCRTPEAAGNFEKMVIIGHSMGGLVTRLLLQKNPYHVIEYFTRQSWEETKKKLTPEDQALLEKAVIPPLPFIRRAVFMAVPHRGAAMAKRQLAHLGIKLIRMPLAILNKTEDFERILKIILPGNKFKWEKNSFITGLDNLNPDGIFMQWLEGALIKGGLPYHSIIGNQKTAETPDGSDGLVPYFSSHLNGAASECIVKSKHNVHTNPAAIREVLRILLLHLEENESENTGE